MSGGSNSVLSINALLKKTEHYDKDERYMATSDLCEVLKRHSSGGDVASGGGGAAAATTGGSGGSSASVSASSSASAGGGGNSVAMVLDAATERRICTAVLRLLHDKSNDVQAIAVKTLGVLLTTVKEEQVVEIADSLADQVLDASKSELRDVYAIGLRTLVKTIPPSIGELTSQRLVGRLLDGIRTSHKEEIVLACLDILTDLLGRFGATAVSVTRQHEPILQMCLHQLSSTSTAPVVRKRAGNTIGCLSVVLSDALLVSMVERLLSQIDNLSNTSIKDATAIDEQQKHSGDTRALIRTMCTVSGAVGHRLGQEQIDRILPIFLRFTDPEDAITGDDEDNDDAGDHEENDDADNGRASSMDEDEPEDEAAIALANELRESCFMGFESFVLRCPVQVQPHLEKIIQASLAYMSYDPNYSYGLETTEDAMEADNNDEDNDYDDDDYDDQEDDEFEDEEDDDDDDDESWKVRRSAIRALKAVVEAKKHDPSALWTVSYKVRKSRSAVVAHALVGRFKEREENCRVGIIDCFTRLLAVTVAAADAGVVHFAAPGGESDPMDISTSAAKSTMIDLRTKYAPILVKACQTLLSVKKGGERSKSNALTLLSTLCKAPGGVGGETEIHSVFTHVQSFLATSSNSSNTNYALQGREASSKTLRLDALSLIHAMLACNNHDPVHIRRGLKRTLLPQLCEAVQEQWYKVIAQALRALAEVPRVFVVGYNEEDRGIQEEETDHVANLLYNAIEPLLAAHDVDQEIKECALTACASLLSNLHASLKQKEQLEQLLSLLLERLKNETTRIAAIKTLSAIASSSDHTEKFIQPGATSKQSKKIDLTSIFSESISTLASFLKLTSRSLKQSSLEALDTVITNHGAGHDAATDSTYVELYSMVLQELSQLVVDSDLHISHLSLRASISILKVCPNCGPAVKEHILPNALILSTSPLLQDLALDSLLALLEQIVVANAVDFHELLFMLQKRLDDGQVSKHAIYNLAKCIAIITAVTTEDNRQGVMSKLLSSLSPPSMDSTATIPMETSSVKQTQLTLLVSGDLGRMVDLGKISGDAEKLQDIYMRYFDSPSEDLKYAAAYALGRAAVGAQSVFLPAIVDALEKNNQKKQYLLLSALRGFIQCSYQHNGGESIAASLPVLLPHLERHCSDPEEGVRTMVAECMGSLTCMQPKLMLEELQKLVSSHSNIQVMEGGTCVVDPSVPVSKKNALVCWTVASSIKLAIAGKADPQQLAQFMPGFLRLLQQKELSVRNAALLMVYSAVHHMPQLVVGSPSSRGSGDEDDIMKNLVMPALFEVAGLKLERKVDLGPFTHTVDDALPLRKASLSIFATCLENIPGSVDIAAFMPVLAKALSDVEDIQLQAHQIIISMCLRRSGTSTGSKNATSSSTSTSSTSETNNDISKPYPSGLAPLTASSSLIVVPQHVYLLQALDTFVDPLEKTINKKQGQKTGTELERLNEWIKSALRTMVALSKVVQQEGGFAGSSATAAPKNLKKFLDFQERTRKNAKFRAILDQLEEER